MDRDADKRDERRENTRGERVVTPDEEAAEWIDEDLAADEDYRDAQRRAGGDATSPMTGRIPVGEVPPLDERDTPGDLDDEIPSSARESPGTVDDLPYSLDEDRPGYKPPLEPLASGDEETDLWEQQQALIDEDRETSVHLEGLTPEEAARVMRASGDDAEPQSQGHSATGSPFEPNHGGFPERPPESSENEERE